MEKIWANRLIAGTKTWDEVPDSRKDYVKDELQCRLDNGEITQEQMGAILSGAEGTGDA